MSGAHRVKGGLIDRGTKLNFKFNDIRMEGFAGDTLASALLANGQLLVGRSFKYHRPRGILTAGSEEPNALVELRTGAAQEPNTRATVTELFDGLLAKSQNHRGSLSFDMMAITDFASPFLTAGFYYKTFMWPKAFWEKLYEPIIRKAAGLGSLSMRDDPDTYDKGFLHCDLLVIGAGPSGLMAALSAARSGARVILADEDFLPGGRLNSEVHEVGGEAGSTWAANTMAELVSMDNVRVMTRTTVYGAYDHGIYGALERCTDHLKTSEGKPRQILWRVYSKRAVLAAGSTERPIAFGNNDRPGIMLAGAVRTYVNRFGVAPGKQMAVFTNNDDGWQTAVDLQAAGVEVIAVIDSRDVDAPMHVPGARHLRGQGIVNTIGRKGVKAVETTGGVTLPVDAVAVSGGWNPNVHLTCHQRGRPEWREDINAFVPGGVLPVGMAVAGAANGAMTLAASLAEGQAVA
ncbi:MAG: 2Fe-2S iron-sulfur cluster-binding protein, partial [Pseudomonadota bacterium]